jgi:D-methionine transport system substrate-binding protein
MRITRTLAAAVLALTIALAGCTPSAQPSASTDPAKPISIGVVGASQDQWSIFKAKAEAAGVKVEIRDFTDYTTENPAVSDGSLTANQFQHILYLAQYNKDNNANLVPIASTAIYPLALYSKKFTAVTDIPKGSQIAVPSDATNKSRAIHVLADAKLLVLKEGTGVIAGEEDIDAAASNVTVAPMDAQQTVTALPSIAGAVVNNDFVNDAGLDPKSALFSDNPNSPAAQPFINVFVVRPADATNENLLKLGRIFHDPEVVAALQKNSGGSAVIVDKTPAELKKILDDVTASLAQG